ncbi:MAG: GH92 family glycosyl hydrolase [Melioribacteraceae bacterium]|nr:GH92 family glycosyl hydrolase [Melioribacteraceae bacterium]
MIKIKDLKIIYVCLLFLLGCSGSGDERYSEYVDPFIGTGGHGHTFPGATVPFGMIQLSPDNPSKGWDWTSGYHYSDSVLLGFSHTHLSGTGVGDLLDILIMPFDSEYPENSENKFNRVHSIYKHNDEIAEPGYYSVFLKKDSIKVELTVTERVGIHRYTFKGNDQGKILLDLGYSQNFDRAIETRIEIIDSTKAVGYRISKGWASYQPVYFAMEFSQPFTAKLFRDKIETDEYLIEGEKTEAVFSFELRENTPLSLKVSISSASIDGAIKNISSEVKSWDFDKYRQAASDAWEKELSKVKVYSNDVQKKNIFYTALYHSLIAPTLFEDANNQYTGADSLVHTTEDYRKYTLFSLWDTFRALHPLLTILKPEIVNDFIHSMLSFYDEYGLLPTWDLQSNETDVMIGYHAVPVIYDAYKKGITNADPEKIHQAMKTSAMQDKFGLNHFKEYCYIPSDLEVEAVSKVLEYAYDDWCVAQMAKDLGYEDDYIYFFERSNAYKLLFDKNTNFMRGKDKKGEWVKDFNPVRADHRSSDYTEANAWQYTFHVLHDVPGLIDLFGGEENFISKLDSLFTISSELEGDVSPDISGLIGQYAHGNEPCHHVAYLYSFTNQKQKGEERIKQIMQTMYKTDPDGLAGNDDCGQMSAWYVFSSLGFYPVNPADGKYWFGIPAFEKIEIMIDSDTEFVIECKGVSKDSNVETVLLNGEKLDRNYITHMEIMNGGKLEFVLINPES